jgi:hypothetical protein
MAKHETSWILELVDQITAPLRNAKKATEGVEDAVNSVRDALGDMSDEQRSVADRALKSHGELTDLYENEQREVKKLTKWLKDLGDEVDPLTKSRIDFDISQAETKSRRYKEQLIEIETELKGIEEGPDPAKLKANWGAAVVVANQASELIDKALSSFDFAIGIEETRTKIARMTGESGDRLDELTAKAHKLGRVFKEDPKEIAKAANAMTKQIGGSWAENFALIEAGYQKGANINGDFLEQLKEYPAFIKQLGITQAEAIALTAQAGQNGIFSDKAIDSLKEADLSLREMGQAQIDALRGIGIEVQDLAGKTSFEAVQMISKNMEGANVAAKQLVLADIFKGAGEDAGLGWIEGLASVDMDINNIKSVKGAGSSLRGWLADLESSFSETFGSIMTNVSELSGATQFMASMIPIVSQLTKVTWLQTAASKIATAGQWLWNAALTANPIGLVVAGIAALVGGIIWAYTEFEGFRKVIHGSWETIKLFGEVIKDYVIDRIKGLLSGITGLGKAVMQFFDGDWKDAWQTGKDAVGDMIGIEAGSKAFGKLKNGIASAYQEGAKEGAASFANDQDKKKSGKTYDDYKFTPTGENFGGLDGTSSVAGGGKKGGGGSSQGSAKIVNMTLNVTNSINVADGKDFWARKDELLDYIVGRMNDGLKDALIMQGS